MALDCDCFRCDEGAARLQTLDEVLAGLRSRLAPVTACERVPLAEALGRILAEDVISGISVPPFDNSAMDGWAVRWDDLGPDHEVSLPVGGRIAAGHPLQGPVSPGHAYRIFTGAPLPSGLDTVVMQEQCRQDGENVVLPAGIKKHGNVRSAGESVQVGGVPLRQGIKLAPQHVGVAATVGRPDLLVRRRLRVAVFSTGDEIVEPGRSLVEGRIYDANRYSLLSLLRRDGHDVTDLGILPDQPQIIRERLREVAAAHDLIVTSGGVSVGDEDHVKGAVQSLGHLHMWRMALKPGKPIALGQIGHTAFLGLPGNPVAVMVTYLLIGRRLAAGLAGEEWAEPRRFLVPAAFSLNKKAGRREFPRARLVPAVNGMAVELHHSDSSGVLTSVSACDGLVELPEAAVTIALGDAVPFIPFSEFAY